MCFHFHKENLSTGKLSRSSYGFPMEIHLQKAYTAGGVKNRIHLQPTCKGSVAWHTFGTCQVTVVCAYAGISLCALWVTIILMFLAFLQRQQRPSTPSSARAAQKAGKGLQ